MNHLELLKKYMRHIVACEGITYVGLITSSSGFTEQEWAVLRDLALKANDEEDHD